MHFILSLVLSLGTVSAAPFELISKRPLGDHQWTRNNRDGCPAYLEEGQFEFPHYITQVSVEEPDRSFGPQYNARITPNDISSIFSIDVPKDRADANCTLEFLFPRQDQLETSSYKYEGPGTFFFTGYLAGSCPGPHTTFHNQPTAGVFPPFPPIHMEPGFAYTIDVGPCTFSAGTCVSGMTSSNDTTFEFFQDKGNCPIGIYNSYSYGLPCPKHYCG
ncbi:ubiquitin 3 binding protein But2 C-terminal domain-containing protein [Annulohypoxylon bovei var. microspora]|nr:ubiquitin 3 binding protein But2 C-terminal domain-containing protein [Annulohypoxylon bovei var. microspora]